jgi:hypothetical protein
LWENHNIKIYFHSPKKRVKWLNCQSSVSMSPGYGGYQATAAKEYYTMSPPNCTTTSKHATPTYYTEAPKHYTTKAPEYYIETYAASSYYTEAPKYTLPRVTSPSTILPSATTPRLHLITPPKRSNSTPKCRRTAPQPTLHRPELHNHICGGKVLLHSVCFFLLRCTGVLHWCSSLLHHNLHWSQVLHRQGTRVLYQYLRCSDLQHRSTVVFSLP